MWEIGFFDWLGIVAIALCAIVTLVMFVVEMIKLHALRHIELSKKDKRKFF